MFVPEDRTLRVQQTPVREKVAQVQKANEEIVIANPGEPLISDVYAQKGPSWIISLTMRGLNIL